MNIDAIKKIEANDNIINNICDYLHETAIYPTDKYEVDGIGVDNMKLLSQDDTESVYECIIAVQVERDAYNAITREHGESPWVYIGGCTIKIKATVTINNNELEISDISRLDKEPPTNLG